MLLLALVLGGVVWDQRGPRSVWVSGPEAVFVALPEEVAEIGFGEGPRWFGAHGEPVDVLRWQRPTQPCGYGHASTQLWVAPWDYGEVELPGGSFDVVGPPYEQGSPPQPAQPTPLWSAAGRLWLLPDDDDVLFIARGSEYEVLRRPAPADPDGPCLME